VRLLPPLYVSGVAGAAFFSLVTGMSVVAFPFPNATFMPFFLVPLITSAMILVPTSLVFMVPLRQLQLQHQISKNFDVFAGLIPLIMYLIGFYPNPMFDNANEAWVRQHAGYMLGGIGIYFGVITTSLTFFAIEPRLRSDRSGISEDLE